MNLDRPIVKTLQPSRHSLPLEPPAKWPQEPGVLEVADAESHRLVHYLVSAMSIDQEKLKVVPLLLALLLKSSLCPLNSMRLGRETFNKSS